MFGGISRSFYINEDIYKRLSTQIRQKRLQS